MPAVIVRSFSDDAAGLNVGIATLHAQVPDVAGNKARIVAALKQMKQQGVNMALFPEFALTGYFWETKRAAGLTWRPIPWKNSRSGWTRKSGRFWTIRCSTCCSTDCAGIRQAAKSFSIPPLLFPKATNFSTTPIYMIKPFCLA